MDNKLGDPKLLLDLPAIPESKHNGGVVMIGPDNNVYTIIGNVNAKEHPAYLIDGVLEDKIANEKGELADDLLGQGFEGGITDLEVSPYDGYLYLLTDAGSIFRILDT